jgi:hypothetical protein
MIKLPYEWGTYEDDLQLLLPFPQAGPQPSLFHQLYKYNAEVYYRICLPISNSPFSSILRKMPIFCDKWLPYAVYFAPLNSQFPD